MKLIIAIVQDEDAGRLISNLMQEGYSVTKLATTGGFLRAGNTTLLLGVDDHKLDGALALIEKIGHSRKQVATSPSPVAGSTGAYVPYPIEVVVGGATVFVLDVLRFADGSPTDAGPYGATRGIGCNAVRRFGRPHWSCPDSFGTGRIGKKHAGAVADPGADVPEPDIGPLRPVPRL